MAAFFAGHIVSFEKLLRVQDSPLQASMPPLPRMPGSPVAVLFHALCPKKQQLRLKKPATWLFLGRPLTQSLPFHPQLTMFTLAKRFEGKTTSAFFWGGPNLVSASGRSLPLGFPPTFARVKPLRGADARPSPAAGAWASKPLCRASRRAGLETYGYDG